jgi:hypothetical protein
LLETLKQTVVSYEEAIRTIKQAGGYAIWAHPGFECHINVIRFKVEELIEYGLDGLEAFHYMNLPDAVAIFSMRSALVIKTLLIICCVKLYCMVYKKGRAYLMVNLRMV